MIKVFSLENRGNGSWRLTISDGYAPDGKKIRFQRTIHVDPMHTPAVQRREAEKQAALLEADFRHGSAPVSHRAVCRDGLCRPCGVYCGQSLLAGRAAARWIKNIKKSLDFSNEIKAFFLVHPAGVEPVAFRVGVAQMGF